MRLPRGALGYPSPVRRMGQQRLPIGLWRSRNQCVPVPARCRCKAPGYVVAKESDSGRMARVGHPYAVPGDEAVLRVGKGRLRAGSEVQQVEPVADRKPR